MIPRKAKITDKTLAQAEVICQSLKQEEDGVRRDVLAHAGSRWALGILHALGVYGTMRHAEIKRQLVGITQRMLTKTLRALERDGLLLRREHDEKPLRVEYELTSLGEDLLLRMSPIWTWVVEHVEDFREARDKFDNQEQRAGVHRSW